MQQRLTTRTAIRDRAARNRQRWRERESPAGKSIGPGGRFISRVTEPDDPRARSIPGIRIIAIGPEDESRVTSLILRSYGFPGVKLSTQAKSWDLF